MYVDEMMRWQKKEELSMFKTKYSIAVIFVTLLLCFAAFEKIGAAANQDAENLFKQGSNFYMEQNYSEAIECYRQAVSIDPNYANAWVYLGVSYYRMGDYQQAVEYVRKGIAINPNDKTAWFNLGKIYRDYGDNNNAIESYRKAISLDADYANAWLNLGNLYFAVGDYNQSIECSSKANELNPKSEAKHTLLAAYGKMERYDEAVDCARKSIRLEPDNARLWYELGAAYYMQHRYSEAEDAFNHAVMLEPQNETYQQWRNIAKDKKGHDMVKNTPCYNCNGTGKCSTCHGSGMIMRQGPMRRDPNGHMLPGNMEPWPCNICNGNGKCHICHGEGKIAA